MLRLPTALLLLLPAIAMAETCPEITDATARLACYDRMSTCLDQEDPAARLACIDSWVLPPQRSSDEANTAPTTTIELPAPVASKTGEEDIPEDFGMPKKTPPGVVISTIVDLDRDAAGRDYLTLENGQTWRETTNQTDRFRIGQQVTIKAAFFGSYSLYVGDSSHFVKVRRVE